jgi:hypothetical protein
MSPTLQNTRAQRNAALARSSSTGHDRFREFAFLVAIGAKADIHQNWLGAFGVSRALGYSHGLEFQKAIRADDPDFFERDRLARIKLLEKFGVSLEHEWEEIIEAVKRMEAGLPEQYKACCR